MQDFDRVNVGEAANVTAFRGLFASTMSANSNYTLSAPLAKYIVLNGTRFRSSHKFTYLPLYDFKKGQSALAKVNISLKNIAFVSSRRDTYIYRPKDLERLDPIHFYSQYEVQNKTKANRDGSNYLKFHHKAPPGYTNLRIIKRKVATIPVVYHDMLYDVSKFPGNILNARYDNDTDVQDHCKIILLLFCNYRNEKELLTHDTYQHSLMYKIEAGETNPDIDKILQNIQDCRNSLNSGRLRDPLENCTNPLPPPENIKTKKKNGVEHSIIDKHIDDNLTDLAFEINEMLGSVGNGIQSDGMNNHYNTINSDSLLNLGAWKLGEDEGITPKFESYGESLVEESVTRNKTGTK